MAELQPDPLSGHEDPAGQEDLAGQEDRGHRDVIMVGITVIPGVIIRGITVTLV